MTICCISFQISTGRSDLFDQTNQRSGRVSMEADAHYMFAKAHVDASAESETEGKTKEQKETKEVNVQYTGSPPDPVTGIIPRSDNPGFVYQKLEPICELLPDKVVEDACYEFVRSDGFCFSALPSQPDNLNNYQEMLEHLVQMKTFKHCGQTGLSLLGYKMNPNSNQLFNYNLTDHLFPRMPQLDNDQPMCFDHCTNSPNCVAAQSLNGQCLFCNKQVGEPWTFDFDMETLLVRFQNIDKAYYTVLCDKLFSDHRLGIVSEVFFNKTGREQGWCRVTFPATESSDHCFKSMEPVTARDSSFLQVFQPSKMPRVPTPQGLPFSANLGVPMFSFDRVFGTPLTSKDFVMEIDYAQATELFDYVMSFDHRVAFGSFEYQGVVDEISLAMAKTCKNFCKESEGCNAIAARIHPPIDLFHDFLIALKSVGWTKFAWDAIQNKRQSMTSDFFDKIFSTYPLTKIWQSHKFDGYQNKTDGVWKFFDAVEKEYLNITDMTLDGFKQIREDALKYYQTSNIQQEQVKADAHHSKSEGGNPTHFFKVIPDNYLDLQYKRQYFWYAGRAAGRPWFPHFAPLQLNASCEFYHDETVVLMGGDNPGCRDFPGFCKMKVGQFIKKEAFDRFSLDEFGGAGTKFY